MGQRYTENFAGETFSEAGWHDGDGSFSIETTGLPTGTTGGAAMKIVMPGADSRYAVKWDDIGTPTGDVALLVRWQVDANVNTGAANSARALICGGGNSAAEDAYFLGHEVDGASSPTPQLVKYDAAAVTALDSDSARTFDANTWYWSLITKSSTTISGSTWTGAAGDDPVTPDVSATDAALAGGWVGPGQFESGQVLWIDIIACGTGGDEAPIEPVSGVIPAIMHHRKMLGAS